jgi:hypothetical protein
MGVVEQEGEAVIMGVHDVRVVGGQDSGVEAKNFVGVEGLEWEASTLASEESINGSEEVFSTRDVVVERNGLGDERIQEGMWGSQIPAVRSRPWGA